MPSRTSPLRPPFLCLLCLLRFASLAGSTSAPLPAQERRTVTMEVPEVRGMPLRDAAVTLREAKIGVALVDSLPSRQRAGIVIVQTPPAGPAAAPVAETLWVARPIRRGEQSVEEWIRERTSTSTAFFSLLDELRRRLDVRAERADRPRVPRVIGLPVDSARRAFARLGIQVAREEEVASGEPRGLVLRQLPPADAVLDPSALGALWVSSGPPPEEPPAAVRVPDLRETPLREARLRLAESSLTLAALDSARADAPRGTIIDQAPAAGAVVRPGSGVEVVVSTGPPEPDTPPDRGGDAPPDSAGDTGGDTPPEDAPPDTAAGPFEDAPPDAPPDRREEVPLEPRVRVPDLRGLTLEEAERVSASVDLTTEPDTPVDDPSRVTVTDQTPVPGTVALAGSPVSVVVVPQAPPGPVLRWTAPLGWLAAGLTLFLLVLGPRRVLAGLHGLGARAFGGGRPGRGSRGPPASRPRFRADPAPPLVGLSWEGSRLWEHSIRLEPRRGPGAVAFRLAPPTPPEDPHA